MSFSETHVTAIRALTGIELERPACFGKSGVEATPIKNELLATTLVDVPALLAGKANGDAGELETASDVAGEDLNGPGSLRRQQHVPCQIEESCHLVPPRDRVARALLRGRRQIAGNDRHDEEREQRNPVLRIGDG